MRTRAFTLSALLVFTLSRSAIADFDKDLDDVGPTVPQSLLHPAIATVPPAAPVPEKPAPFAEPGPRDIEQYIADGEIPNFIRVDLKGYNVRTSPSFSPDDRSNVDFHANAGDYFPVEDMRPMYYGAAVQIRTGDDLRWVYVPYDRKSDFQFCESEACFGAMAQTLDYLIRDTGVTSAEARACGISAGPEGLLLPGGAGDPHHADIFEDAIAKAPPKSAPKPAPVASNLNYKLGWEKRTSAGRGFTAALSQAFEKYGKALENQKNLGDAYAFCPNYSRLNTPELKKEFWMQLFSSIAFAESTDQAIYPPYDEGSKHNVSRSTPITSYGEQKYSMGLFALTYKYADSPLYQPFCSSFSFRADAGKSVTDPRLTINNVQNQANCAVGIMNYYVSHHGSIGYTGTASRGPAWSTVMSYNPATRQKTIPELKRNFPVCFGGRK